MTPRITYQEVVSTLAHQWRCLVAWRAILPAKLSFEEYKGQANYVGIAHPHACKAKVRLTGRSASSLAFDLGTVLHELAHLAAPNGEHHGDRWRELYIAGVCEVVAGRDGRADPFCTADSFETDVKLTDLGAQTRKALLGWLNRTGQTHVLRSIGVLVE